MHGLPLLLLAFAAVGCGGSSRPEPSIPAPMPTLTIEQWKEMPPEEKYDEATFDRLREADPKLKKRREWDKFMKTVVIPERKIDIPAAPGS